MRVAENWKEYRILDTASQEKLEMWNRVTLIRPDPQIIWNTPKRHPQWRTADGHYTRSSSGGGSWQFQKKAAGVLDHAVSAAGFNFSDSANWI